MPVPSVDHLYNPVLQSMKFLGGSASILELDEAATERLQLSEEEINQPHDERITELAYRLAWARTHLKLYGLLTNSERGVWVLTPEGTKVDAVDPRQVRRFLSERRRNGQRRHRGEPLPAVLESEAVEVVLQQSWREQLQATLLSLSPDAFERLCQRMLRESGFVQVTVTGRSGDGGIDGVGIVRLGGLLGFPILFQCKRYQGTVGAGVIRDFRGAMVGRADRGLVITTGAFSREARQEATRDGAPPIDLLDGEQLLDKLKELRLGVKIELIEEVTVLSDWFGDL